MKKTLLLIALAIAAFSAKSQGFSQVCETGQSLYYRVIDKQKLYVEVTMPHKFNLYYDDKYATWEKFAKPVGDIVIPGEVQFNGTVYAVKGIDKSTFHDCDLITSVVIPNTVTTIGDFAFYKCKKLKSVTIPNSVVSIGSWAFYYCESLTSVIIPNSVKVIQDFAFNYCNSLKSLTLSENVTYIGHSAFSGTDIKEINIPASVTRLYWFGNFDKITVSPDNQVYDSRDNCNAVITRNGDTLVLGSDNTVVPNTVKYIGSQAFLGCKNLKSIAIPPSVKGIGENAFEGCGLENITIPATVEIIRTNAFNECKDLTSFMIESPSTLMITFDEENQETFSAITNCPNVTISLATTPLKLEKGKFSIETWSWDDGSSSGYPVYRIIVPCGMAEQYNNSDWKKVFDSFIDDCK